MSLRVLGKWNYRAIPKVKTRSCFLTIPKFSKAPMLSFNNKMKVVLQCPN